MIRLAEAASIVSGVLVLLAVLAVAGLTGGGL